MLAAGTEWISKFQADRAAVKVLERPLLRLCAGGLITVSTNAANEVKLRLPPNLYTLYHRDRPKLNLVGLKKAAGSLVYSRISQTDTSTGEIQGTTRDRKFTDEAAHKIREAGGILDAVYSKDCWFLTVTLPGDTVEAIEAFAKYDKEIKNAYLQNFRKVFQKMGLSGTRDFDYLCVSELQARGAIHWHFAIGWASERFARFIKRCYRRWWHKILLRYSDISGVDLCARDGDFSWRDKPQNFLVECEQVEYSVGQYLSKYLSKAESKDRRPGVNSPSRWWSISVALRRKLLDARLSESTFFTTRVDAQGQLNKAVKALSGAGYDLLPSYNKFSKHLTGFICFPPKGKRMHVFEYAKLLCTTSGAGYWDERTSVYAFDELFEDSSE